MVPLQYAAEYPRFLQNDLPVDTAVGLSWTTRTPTPTHPPPPSEIEKEENPTQKQPDRNSYLSHIKARADREGGVLPSPISIQMNKHRYWWCAAANRADAHRAMVACDWDPYVASSLARATSMPSFDLELCCPPPPLSSLVIISIIHSDFLWPLLTSRGCVCVWKEVTRILLRPLEEGIIP